MSRRALIVLVAVLACVFVVPARAEVSDAEQGAIAAYVAREGLAGTWKARAVAAWVRMERTGDYRFRPAEVAVEIDWMLAKLREAAPVNRSVATLYGQLGDDLSRMRGAQARRA